MVAIFAFVNNVVWLRKNVLFILFSRNLLLHIRRYWPNNTLLSFGYIFIRSPRKVHTWQSRNKTSHMFDLKGHPPVPFKRGKCEKIILSRLVFNSDLGAMLPYEGAQHITSTTKTRIYLVIHRSNRRDHAKTWQDISFQNTTKGWQSIALIQHAQIIPFLVVLKSNESVVIFDLEKVSGLTLRWTRSWDFGSS